MNKIATKKISFIPRKIYLIIAFAAFIILLNSCKGYRSTLKAPIKEQGADYLMEQLQLNSFKFNTLTSKFTVDYAYKRIRYDIKGQIRIVKDSAIWVSFNQDLGIELARLLITQDSVKFMNRLTKSYFAGNHSFVNDFLNANIDYEILQSLILGNDFEYYENASFKAAIDGKNYKLSTTGRSKLKKHVRNNDDNTRILLQTIWLNPNTFKINEIKLKELTKDSKKLNAKYSNFVNIGSQKLASRADYVIEDKSPIKVTVKHSKIITDEKVSMPFAIPDNYRRE